MSIASLLLRLPLPALGLLALCLGGCAPLARPDFHQPWLGWIPAPKPTQPGVPNAHKAPTFWEGDQVAGAPAITIDLGAQRAYFIKGKMVVGETPISSGRSGYDTPPGRYSVIQKDKDHRSNLYGDFVNQDGEVVKANADMSKQSPPPGTTFLGAKMPYFLRFQGGYGLHAGRLPGHRASHGCVRLPLLMAQHFYENAPIGTPVLVRP